MTNPQYCNSGCVGNSKKTWLGWLAGNLGSAPPKHSPDVSGKSWTALSPALSKARKATHCISQLPRSRHGRGAKREGGRIVTLHHLMKQRGGQRTWDQSGELSSTQTSTESRVWEGRRTVSLVRSESLVALKDGQQSSRSPSLQHAEREQHWSTDFFKSKQDTQVQI